MRFKRSSRGKIAIAAAVFSGLLFSQGCALDFSDDDFQRLKVFFELTEVLAQGEATLAHTWFFPTSIKVSKRWVRVSGRMNVPEGARIPSQVTVVAGFEDIETGKRQARVSIKVKIDDDGSFSARSKIKKNIVAASLMMVTIEPIGSDLEEDTELTLCVDLVESKKDLGTIPACVNAGDAGGAGDNGDEGAGTLTQLQSSLFTPTCARSGCHNAASASAGMVLEAGRTFAATVNVPSSQLPQFDRIEPGDPESSYMVKKLRGDSDISGSQMPRGGPFLTDAQLAELISWINAGALDN